MAMFSKTTGNLLGGVSQQPDNLRFANMAEESVNTHASLSGGLAKRPGSEFVIAREQKSATDFTTTAARKIHLINRDAIERYAIWFRNKADLTAKDNGILVTDLTESNLGGAITVYESSRVTVHDTVEEVHYTDSSKTFTITDGVWDTTLGVGDLISVEGFAHSPGNTTHRVTSSTTTTIVIATAIGTDMAAETDITIHKTLGILEDSDLAYLVGANLEEDVDCMTVGDYTFVLNKNTEVAMDTDLTSAEVEEGLVIVKKGAYNQKYAVRLNGTEYSLPIDYYADFTPDNVAGKTPPATARVEAEAIATDEIAAGLAKAITDGNSIVAEITRVDPSSGFDRAWGVKFHHATAGTFKVTINDLLHDKGIADLLEGTHSVTTANITYSATASTMVTNINTAVDTAIAGNSFWLGLLFGGADAFTCSSSGGTDTADATFKFDFKKEGAGDLLSLIRSIGIVVTDLTGAGGEDHITIERGGHVLYIKAEDSHGLSMTSSDGASGENIGVAKGSVESISDMPKVAMSGMIMKVAGNPEESVDDYYAKFVGQDAIVSEGHWEETIAPGIQYKIDAATMPHVMVRQFDDSRGVLTGTAYKAYFTWGEYDWTNRLVGDTETNADPSFVGSKITGMTFHKGRLGLMSGESLSMTEAGQSKNFWRTTVVDILDTGRIDLTASTRDASNLRSSVEIQDALILFSGQNQLVLDSGGTLLTPSSAGLISASGFQASTKAKPVASGNIALFGFTRGDYSGVSQFYQDRDGFNAVEVSGHVPNYLQGDIRLMSVCEAENMAAFVTDATGLENTIFIYKWHSIGKDRVQSAWSKVEMPGVLKILDIGFIDSHLYIGLIRGIADEYHGLIERMSWEVGKKHASSWYHPTLDSLCDTEAANNQIYHTVGVTVENGVDYNGVTNISTFAISSPTGGRDLVLIDKHDSGVFAGPQIIPYDSDSESEVIPRVTDGSLGSANVVVYGDWTIPTQTGGHGTGARTRKFWAGWGYEMRHTMAHPYLEGKSGDRSSALLEGRFQVRRATVDVAGAGYWRSEVTPDGRDMSTEDFSPATIGVDTVGSTGPMKGPEKVSVMAQAGKFTFDLVNDSPFPSRFTSLEWEGTFSSRSKRLG